MKCRSWVTWLDTTYFPGDLRWFYCRPTGLSFRLYGLYENGRWENYMELSTGAVLREEIQ
jgi:hypothetical protein